jgi:hypothetical protein
VIETKNGANMYNKKGYIISLTIAAQTLAGAAWATQGSDGILETLRRITSNTEAHDDFPQSPAERRRSSEVTYGTTIIFGTTAPKPQNAAEKRRGAGGF